MQDVAIDLGINFFDTAACYNNSEDLVGNAINSRRDEFFLATKCGHPTNRINGTEWTKDIISKTIDDSLKRLKTDYLDLIQLHSCEKEILEKGLAYEANGSVYFDVIKFNEDHDYGKLSGRKLPAGVEPGLYLEQGAVGITWKTMQGVSSPSPTTNPASSVS